MLRIAQRGPDPQQQQNISDISFAEPPLFRAAPAPEVRGPGADSGSDHTAEAPLQCSNVFVLLDSTAVPRGPDPHSGSALPVL